MKPLGHVQMNIFAIGWISFKPQKRLSSLETALAEEARLKYIRIVAAAAITSEALRVNVHTKNRNSQIVYVYLCN